MSELQQFSIRLTKEMIEEIKDLANRGDRNLNMQVAHLIKKGLIALDSEGYPGYEIVRKKKINRKVVSRSK